MKNKAFTLVELLVVVLIIGILAAIAVPQYQKAVAKSRYIELVTVGESIKKAEEIYYLTHGNYTTKLSELDIVFPTEKVNIEIPDISVGRPHATISTPEDKLGMSYKIYFDNFYGESTVIAQGCHYCIVTDGREDYLKGICKSLTGITADNKAGTQYLYAYSCCDIRYSWTCPNGI